MDFSRTSNKIADTTDLSDAFAQLLDKTIAEHAEAEYAKGRGSGVGEVAKKRIGAGYIGTECTRELAYRFHKYQKEPFDPERGFVNPGELNRHAQVGHWTEEKMTEWMQMSGFNLAVQRENGRQFNFLTAHDPESGQAQLAGEVDGVISAPFPAKVQPYIPADCDVMLWESKKATAKKYNKFKKEGVKKAGAVYYAQMQTCMAYMNVKYCLFTMMNMDNMKIYPEIVAFDASAAQELTDRAVRVIRSDNPQEFPRIAREETDFRCRFCDYWNQCWADTRQVTAAPHGDVMSKPAWME